MKLLHAQQYKILAFARSLRAGSFNNIFPRTAVVAAEGATVTTIDLADSPMPIYDGDFKAQNGLPECAQSAQSPSRPD